MFKKEVVVASSATIPNNLAFLLSTVELVPTVPIGAAERLVVFG